MLGTKSTTGAIGGIVTFALLSLSQAAKAEVTLYAGGGAAPSLIGYLQIEAGPRVMTNVDLAQYNGKTGTARLVQIASNDWATSIGGIKGAAQLTSDWKGIYLLESGFDTGTGVFDNNQGKVFSRRAYAGLSNPKFGTLFFGKNQTMAGDSYSFDPMIMESASTPTLINGRNFEAKPDNVVEYHSPKWAGFQIGTQIQLSAGSTSTGTKLSNLYGVSAQYDISNLSLYAIYDVMQDAEGRYTNLYTASRERILGATLNLAPVKLFAGYIRLDAPDASEAKGGTPIRNPGARYTPYAPVFATSANMSWIGAEYAVTPKLTVRGAWYHTGIGDNGGKADLYASGFEYNFSPYLLLYATVAQVRNKGKADFSAALYASPPPPGKPQMTAFTGVSVHF